MSARIRARRVALPAVAAVAAVALGLLGGCAAAPDVPDTPAAPTPTASLAAAPSPPAKCEDGLAATQSFAPLPRLDAPPGSLQAEIRDRGRLVVGVSSDSYLLGSLARGSSDDFEGFDIDIARKVAQAATGKASNNIQFKVLTAAGRVDAVNAGVKGRGVDLVARNMTMTCDRWKQVNFSAVYFAAAQKVLVRKGGPRTLQEVGTAKGRVCAPTGSTSLNALPRLAPGAVPVGADQHTACLALLQEGRIDAITGDDTVLAGLAAQDPATEVVGGKLSSEPYGLAVAKQHPEFARFVNTVLEQARTDGSWQASYDKWFDDSLDPAKPPAPSYGRPVPGS